MGGKCCSGAGGDTLDSGFDLGDRSEFYVPNVITAKKETQTPGETSTTMDMATETTDTVPRDSSRGAVVPEETPVVHRQVSSLESEDGTPVVVQASGKSENSRFTPTGKSDDSEPDADVDTGCCIYWVLSVYDQGHIAMHRLRRLHEEIADCVKLFQAEVLLDDAVSGLIRGWPVPHEEMSSADVAARIGQLICRWAAAQEPSVGVFVGVHDGTIRALSLPNSERQGFFGEAPSEARQLCTMHAKERMVHLSQAAKNGLSRLRLLPLAVSPTRESFYLDPFTEANAQTSAKDRLPSRKSGGRRLSAQVRRTRLSFAASLGLSADVCQGAGGSQQSLETFIAFLQSHGVDITKFGKNSAMGIEDFYKAVVINRQCHLDVVAINDEAPQLERIVALVRVSLRARAENGELRELRLVPNPDEALTADMRSSGVSQPLTIIMSDGEHNDWQQALEQHFANIFKVSQDFQAECFRCDPELNTYKEERSSSEMLPDIVTTYKSHNVVLEVTKPTHAVMKHLGLPTCVDFHTEGRGGVSSRWTWAPLEIHKEDQLMEMLLAHGVEVNDFSPNAFAELYDELYVRKISSLETVGGDFVRSIRIIKVEVFANIFGVEHKLVVKAKYQKGICDDRDAGNPVTMRMSPEQEWQDAVVDALTLRLGFSPEMQTDHLFVDCMSHDVTEEIAYSRTYPGLKSIYEVNRVRAWIMDAQEGRLSVIGLPSATDFTFARRERTSRVAGEGDLVVTQWGWQLSTRRGDMAMVRQKTIMDVPKRRVSKTLRDDEKRRVPAPVVDRGRALSAPPAKPKYKAVPVLCNVMQGKETNWARARVAATRILDQDYTCQAFHDDITAAFPELTLYCVEGDAGGTTCGRTADDEYQRTIGALFALFWLMRAHCGGKESFCFGLDDNWQPRRPSDYLVGEAVAADVKEEWKKRKKFYESTDWTGLTKLLVDAGLLKAPGGPHDVDRTMAMLVLLVIHDIMKLAALQPTVDRSGFSGFKSGEPITDHDIALSFVLARAPDVLPSFVGLTAAQRETIKFTHSKLEYNMGWLVQAEAPPGALLRTFKKVVSSGKVPASDIAFYFVHWLADLAGAEPCPLEGCEKFVLKFPQKILEQFVESFSFIQTLSVAPETKIVEEYLEWRWSNQWGPVPQGGQSIAKMRLVCMAQGDSESILDHFDGLTFDDRNVLGWEMAMTGCKGQQFARDPLNETDHHKKGPAFLVYYAPALMQRAGKKDPRGALVVLAEVFRKARLLWPLAAKEVDKCVTVRIDALKELEVAGIMKPESGMQFVLSKTNNLEAVVQAKHIDEFQDLDWRTHQVLTFLGGRRTTFKRRRTQVGSGSGYAV